MKHISLRLIALLAVVLAYPALAQSQTEADQKVIGLVQHAEDLCDTDRSGEAEPLLNEAASIKPDFADIYRVWGCAYDKQGHWSKAEEKYKKWAELNPHSYKPFEALGEEAYKQHHYAESNDYLAEAKRLNPFRTYILNYRCNNFLRMEKWQEAIAECTAAITLNPRDEYAYGERSRAERALGENEKAGSDASAAGKYHNDYGRSLFIEKIFPALFGIIALALFYSGLTVLLRRKPLLFSSRWIFALMLICFAPQLIMPFTMPDLPGDSLEGLRIMNWLMPVMFVVLLAFLWKQMRGYIVFGVVDRSFRKALLSVLDELRLERQEELSFIRIPSADLDIQVAIQSWAGTGQIKNKSRSGQEVFQQIIEGLQRRFALGELETNNATPVLYIILGIFMLIFCGVFLTVF